MIQSIETLKSYFETGDVPTEQQFISLIDSMYHKNSGAILIGIQTDDSNGNIILTFSDDSQVVIEKVPESFSISDIEGLQTILDSKINSVNGDLIDNTDPNNPIVLRTDIIRKTDEITPANSFTEDKTIGGDLKIVDGKLILKPNTSIGKSIITGEGNPNNKIIRFDLNAGGFIELFSAASNQASINNSGRLKVNQRVEFVSGILQTSTGNTPFIIRQSDNTGGNKFEAANDYIRLYENTGIGGIPNAALDVQSTENGILIPRLATTQRDAIAAPALSEMIFNTTEGSYQFFDGLDWVNLISEKNAIYTPKIQFADFNFNPILLETTRTVQITGYFLDTVQSIEVESPSGLTYTTSIVSQSHTTLDVELTSLATQEEVVLNLITPFGEFTVPEAVVITNGTVLIPDITGNTLWENVDSNCTVSAGSIERYTGIGTYKGATFGVIPANKDFKLLLRVVAFPNSDSCILGLNSVQSDSTYSGLNYGLQLFEGTFRTATGSFGGFGQITAYNMNDLITIEREGTTVRAKIGNTVISEAFGQDTSQPLYFDSYFFGLGSIDSIKIIYY